jgi:hypothetical protein
MLASIRRRLHAHLVAALFSVGALALAGCKQGVGERCEQGSDCSSGICGSPGFAMTSPAGKLCVASGTVFTPPIDSGNGTTNASDAAPASDALDAPASDALDAPASEASGAGADVAPSGDGPTDTAEAGHD